MNWISNNVSPLDTSQRISYIICNSFDPVYNVDVYLIIATMKKPTNINVILWIESKVTRFCLLQPGAPTMRVLHISDIHMDFDYTPGTEAQCGEPVCCRKSSPRGSQFLSQCILFLMVFYFVVHICWQKCHDNIIGCVGTVFI